MNLSNDSLQNMRKDYQSGELSVDDFALNPIVEFKKWFERATDQGVAEPNAFTLSTVNEKGEPNSRIVLVKEIRENGIIFYTNYESRKGKDLAENKNVAVCFFWQPLSQQIRIKGICSKLPASESDIYYQKRPLGSRIGAITSPQSQVIESRDWLLSVWRENEKKYGKHPARPPYWGGYLIEFTEVEFWQGQPSRLHDRFRYTKNSKNITNWKIERLAP